MLYCLLAGGLALFSLVEEIAYILRTVFSSTPLLSVFEIICELHCLFCFQTIIRWRCHSLTIWLNLLRIHGSLNISVIGLSYASLFHHHLTIMHLLLTLILQ